MICCDAIREREHQEEVRCVSDECTTDRGKGPDKSKDGLERTDAGRSRRTEREDAGAAAIQTCTAELAASFL